MPTFSDKTRNSRRTRNQRRNGSESGYSWDGSDLSAQNYTSSNNSLSSTSSDPQFVGLMQDCSMDDPKQFSERSLCTTAASSGYFSDGRIEAYLHNKTIRSSSSKNRRSLNREIQNENSKLSHSRKSGSRQTLPYKPCSHQLEMVPVVRIVAPKYLNHTYENVINVPMNRIRLPPKTTAGCPVPKSRQVIRKDRFVENPSVDNVVLTSGDNTYVNWSMKPEGKPRIIYPQRVSRPSQKDPGENYEWEATYVNVFEFSSKNKKNETLQFRKSQQSSEAHNEGEKSVAGFLRRVKNGPIGRIVHSVKKKIS